jgi:hypothetical protein
MAGLFGTRAVLQTDIDLILQVIVVVILAVALLYRKTPAKVKKHGIIMAGATLLQVVTFLILMEPVFFTYLNTFLTVLAPSITTFLIHAITGTATLALALGLVISWATRPSNLGPCYKRKKLMYATLGVWIVTAALGITGYVFGYVLPI